MSNATGSIQNVTTQPSWTIRSLLLVLLVYNLYLFVQFLATIWGWLLANLDIRLAVLLATDSLMPPVLALYVYATSENRIRQLCNRRKKKDVTASGIFDECAKVFALENRVEFWINDSDALDAFAFGRGKKGIVVVTKGLVDRLSNDELRGVLSHELTHIKNGDHSIMTWASSLVRVYKFFLPVYLMLSLSTIAFDVVLGNPLGDPAWVFVHSLTTILMVFVIPTILIDSLSRTREYVADFNAYSITRTFPIALIKFAPSFTPLATNSEMLSLLPRFGSRQTHRLFSVHPPLKDRIRKMYAGTAPNFRILDCPKIGVIVAISTILMIEAIPSSVIYIFALIPLLFREQTTVITSLALSLRYFDSVIYTLEVVVPAVILYFAIPNIKEAVNSRRDAVICGLATCVGFLPVPLFFVLPGQAVTLGGPFPIPRRVWPAPPSTFSALFSAAIAYFVMLCTISMIEWMIVPALRSHANSLSTMRFHRILLLKRRNSSL